MVGACHASRTRAGLLDECQVMITPLVLGGGKQLFENASRRILAARGASRTGVLIAVYRPEGR